MLLEILVEKLNSSCLENLLKKDDPGIPILNKFPFLIEDVIVVHSLKVSDKSDDVPLNNAPTILIISTVLFITGMPLCT